MTEEEEAQEKLRRRKERWALSELKTARMKVEELRKRLVKAELALEELEEGLEEKRGE